MRAAMYYSNSDIRIEELPCPRIGEGELLVRVEASGICGSDVMEWYRLGRTPLVLGHEIAGTVEEAGRRVKGYKKGERVVCAHHVPCGKCRYCLKGHESVCDTLRKTNFDPGGFSEFTRIPRINVDYGVFKLPDKVSFEEGTFVEPLACVMRGQRIAGLKPKDTLLVVGSGIAGLMHIHLARVKGAGLIIATDIRGYRLEAAKKFGADISLDARSYNPDMLRQANQGRLADIVIVSTGAPSAISQALDSVERGGTVLFFAPTQENGGIQVPFNALFWRNEISLTSSYAASPQEYRQALDLISTKKVNIGGMITHRLGLADTGQGFQLVAGAQESLKVIIYPQK